MFVSLLVLTMQNLDLELIFGSLSLAPALKSSFTALLLLLRSKSSTHYSVKSSNQRGEVDEKSETMY
jgi:hypothetical protein